MLKFCLPRGDPLGKEDGWIFRSDKGRTLLSLRISFNQDGSARLAGLSGRNALLLLGRLLLPPCS